MCALKAIIGWALVRTNHQKAHATDNWRREEWRSGRWTGIRSMQAWRTNNSQRPGHRTKLAAAGATAGPGVHGQCRLEKALKAAGQVGEQQLGSKIGLKGSPAKNVHAGQAVPGKKRGGESWAVGGARVKQIKLVH